MLIVEQVYSCLSQSQGQICTLFLELLQNDAAWHVLADSSPAPQENAFIGFIYTSGEVGDLMAPSFQNCLPEQLTQA